jgi:hypothetical protein
VLLLNENERARVALLSPDAGLLIEKGEDLSAGLPKENGAATGAGAGLSVEEADVLDVPNVNGFEAIVSDGLLKVNPPVLAVVEVASSDSLDGLENEKAAGAVLLSDPEVLLLPNKLKEDVVGLSDSATEGLENENGEVADVALVVDLLDPIDVILARLPGALSSSSLSLVSTLAAGFPNNPKEGVVNSLLAVVEAEGMKGAAVAGNEVVLLFSVLDLVKLAKGDGVYVALFDDS